jgi:hypothetical protein
MSNFSTADKVADCVAQMRIPEIIRSQNRANIDGLFNGLPPFTAQQAKDNQIQWNTNLKMGTVLLQRANRQFENAILKPGVPFTVALPDAPAAESAKWARSITRRMGFLIKKGRNSRVYAQVQRQQLKGTILHGVGAKMWQDKEKWCPHFVGMQDILMPTDTDTDLTNLQFFAVRREMRAGELLKKCESGAPGWNKKLVYRVFDSMKELNMGNEQTYTWADNPEKWSEFWKQNLGWYSSDKAPVVRTWDFYYWEDSSENKKEGWYRCIVLDPESSFPEVATEGDGTEFLYELDEPFAPELSHFIHFQFGDGNVVPPYKYHSIRSLGYLLYDTVYMLNRLQIAFTEHVFESMMTLLKVTEPGDRNRVTKILLENKGIIPEGVEIVPADQRYSVRSDLIQGLNGNLRQLIGEAAASYVEQLDSGTGKEQTATETMVKASNLNVMVGAMLNLAYSQEEDCYREICRRFCLKDSADPDVKKFQQQIQDDGVPAEWIDASRWDVSAVRSLGNGDRTLELAEAQQLVQVLPQLQSLNPEAPRIIMRRFVGAVSNDALAEELIPDGNDAASDSMHDAQLTFAAMMDGVPVAPKKGANIREQAGVVVSLMQNKAQQIEQSGGMATQDQIAGLTMASGYVQSLLQQLEADKANNQFVKQSMDVLGNVMNMVKAFAQRLQEQQQAQAEASQRDPVAEAKIQLDAQRAQMQAQIDMQRIEIEKLRTQAQIQNQNMVSMADIQRKDAAAQAEIARKDALAASEMERTAVETAAGMAMDGAKTRSTIRQGEKKTDASIEAQKKTADAQAKLTAKKKSAKKPSDA